MDPYSFLAPGPAPPRSAVPSWANPSALMAGTAVRVTPVVGDVAVAVLAAAADPTRIGIGFGIGNLGALPVGVTLNPLSDGWVIPSNATGSQAWFTVFDYGPLVNLQWFAGPNAGATFVVYEWYRLS